MAERTTLGRREGPGHTQKTVRGRWLAIGLAVFIVVVAGLGYYILLSNYKGTMFSR